MSEFSLTVETPEPWQRVVKVTVPRHEYDKQYQQRLTSAVRAHQRPGFRKGKTPRGIVESELGSRLRAETFEALVPQAYRAAVIEHRLLPITEPTLENLSFEDDQDLSFDLRIEVRPEVEAANYEGLPVTEREVEIRAEEVDEAIERLREARAIYEKVDRAAAEGDQVVLDLTPRKDDGSLDEEKKITDQRLTLGGEQNLPAFNEALMGVEAGQEREIEIEYPAEYANQDMAGRTVTFLCQVDSVQIRVVPEADDAFASHLEEGQTLLELRGRIRESLADDARKRVAQELDEQILDGLVDRNEISVPPSMVEAWLQSGLKELHQRNEQAGRPRTEEEDQRYREAVQPAAERQIKGMFLLESVRRQEGIVVTDEEIEAKIDAIAAEHGFDPDKYREYVEKGEEKERIRHGLEERKTYDFLLSRGEVDAAPAAKEDEG